MSTSKLDAIRELLKTQSEKHVIQAVWSAYQLTEAEAVRMVKQAQGIDTTVQGYPDPFIVATEWLTVEQGRANGVAVTCAPEIKSNNHKKVFTGWVSSIMEHRALYTRVIENCNLMLKVNNACNHLHGSYGACEAADQTPESFMHQVFIDYTNENTNRV